MHEVAIVGAGQLGSRHLQALAALDRSYHVHVVEPADPCVERARSRWDEVATPTSPELVWLHRLDQLPAAVDVAVVATAADVRRAVIEALLGKTRVRHLVLEKVLFQRVADYAPTLAAIEAVTESAWVNCPRRMWLFYAQLRTRLHGEVRMTVSGSRWALGSSALHFLDLFAFLGGGDDLRVGTLHTVSVPTWRTGFEELAGELAGRGPHGSFAIASLADGDLPLIVEVMCPRLRAIVREGEGKAWLSSAADSWRWQEESFDVVPQSRLTHRVVADLIASGTCALTPLAQSVQHHLAFLQPLSQQLGVDRCPIT